jgi:hypothetical protein
MAKIHNIRLGFATNSSSTHSILLFNKDAIKPDIDKCFGDESQDFGWENFTLTSECVKRQYIGQHLKDAFISLYKLPETEAAILATNWCNVYIDPEGYIDHQSVIGFPCSERFGRITINKNFFDQFLDWVLQERVIILGGNDNGNSHPLLDLVEQNKAKCLHREKYSEYNDDNVLFNFFEGESKYLRGRYDSTGKFWTIFRKTDGAKIRFSFTEESFNASKSEVPELVDVKITDYCESNCSFCYQNSSMDGMHANINTIRQVIRHLSELNVFEIAFGGGEPTKHPHFLEMIDLCNDLGIVPNFSTRNINWLIDNQDKLSGKIGAVGLSVGESDLEEELKRIPFIYTYPKKINCTLQLAVGSCSEEKLEQVLETCKKYNLTLLLLGWKNIGRGLCGPIHEVRLEKILNRFIKTDSYYSADPQHYEYWDGPNVSFDTVLVQQMKTWLESHKIPERLFTTKEGAHSMYIDCVFETMGRSSFSSKMVKLQNASDGIKKYFQSL